MSQEQGDAMSQGDVMSQGDAMSFKDITLSNAESIPYTNHESQQAVNKDLRICNNWGHCKESIRDLKLTKLKSNKNHLPIISKVLRAASSLLFGSYNWSHFNPIDRWGHLETVKNLLYYTGGVGQSRRSRSDFREDILLVIQSIALKTDYLTLFYGRPGTHEYVYYNYSHISEQSGLSISQVNRAMKSLKSNGLVVVKNIVLPMEDDQYRTSRVEISLTHKLFEMIGLLGCLKKAQAYLIDILNKKLKERSKTAENRTLLKDNKEKYPSPMSVIAEGVLSILSPYLYHADFKNKPPP